MGWSFFVYSKILFSRIESISHYYQEAKCAVELMLPAEYKLIWAPSSLSLFQRSITVETFLTVRSLQKCLLELYRVVERRVKKEVVRWTALSLSKTTDRSQFSFFATLQPLFWVPFVTKKRDTLTGRIPWNMILSVSYFCQARRRRQIGRERRATFFTILHLPQQQSLLFIPISPFPSFLFLLQRVPYLKNCAIRCASMSE